MTWSLRVGPSLYSLRRYCMGVSGSRAAAGGGMPVLRTCMWLAYSLLGTCGWHARCFAVVVGQPRNEERKRMGMGTTGKQSGWGCRSQIPRCSRPNEPCVSTRRAAFLLEARWRGSTPTKAEAQKDLPLGLHNITCLSLALSFCRVSPALCSDLAACCCSCCCSPPFSSPLHL